MVRERNKLLVQSIDRFAPGECAVGVLQSKALEESYSGLRAPVTSQLAALMWLRLRRQSCRYIIASVITSCFSEDPQLSLDA